MNFETLIGPLLEKLEGWLSGFVAMLPNLGVAALVVFLSAIAAKWAGRGAQKGLRRVLKSEEIADLLAKVVHLTVLIAGLFTALGILNLDKTVTSLLAGVGIAGLALGFAFQDIAANFVSGVLMAVRRPFAVGDLVQISGHMGIVESIDLRATNLRSLSGESLILPNKDVFQNPIENFTQTDSRRVDFDVGVSYGDDLEKAKAVATKAVEPHSMRMSDREVEVFFTGFGASSVDFTLRFWIESPDQKSYLAARSEAIMALKKAFDDNELTIPFPIRTLDFGILGGKPLHEELQGSPTPPLRAAGE